MQEKIQYLILILISFFVDASTTLPLQNETTITIQGNSFNDDHFEMLLKDEQGKSHRVRVKNTCLKYLPTIEAQMGSPCRDRDTIELLPENVSFHAFTRVLHPILESCKFTQ